MCVIRLTAIQSAKREREHIESGKYCPEKCTNKATTNNIYTQTHTQRISMKTKYLINQEIKP